MGQSRRAASDGRLAAGAFVLLAAATNREQNSIFFSM
jgi:hypothetical protein